MYKNHHSSIPPFLEPDNIPSDAFNKLFARQSGGVQESELSDIFKEIPPFMLGEDTYLNSINGEISELDIQSVINNPSLVDASQKLTNWSQSHLSNITAEDVKCAQNN